MAKLKNPYTYPHKSRRAKVDYLTSIGGYYADRWAKFPIEFQVGTYHADLDFDSVWERLNDSAQGYWDIAEFRPDLMRFCAQEAHRRLDSSRDNSLWSMAIDDARNSLMDTDAYCTLWDGTPVSPTFNLYGRGGKHLCLEEVAGITLKGLSEEELEEMLMLQTHVNNGDETSERNTLLKDHEWAVSTEALDKLYRYVRQCEIDFTSVKASREVEYQADSIVRDHAQTLYAELFGTAPETCAEKLGEAAMTVFKALNALDSDQALAFRILCVAAGVNIDELVIDAQ